MTSSPRQIQMIHRTGWQVLFLLVLCCGLCEGQVGQTSGRTLLHEGWTFRDPSGVWRGQAILPGSIHTDLLANGWIEDPYFGEHARTLGWIDTTTWIYERQLDLRAWGPDQHLDLVFAGLDTYAEVWIVDSLVLQAQNMFREWRISLDRSILPSLVRIKVIFYPAIRKGEEASRLTPWTYPADSDPFPGKPSVFSRKAAYQFGWDFAPPLVGCGIWRSVWMEHWRHVRWRDGYMETRFASPDSAKIVIHGTLEADVLDTVLVKAVIDSDSVFIQTVVQPGIQSIALPVLIRHPRLWWPHDQGDPARYPVRLIAYSSTGSDTLAWMGGIRTVQLDQTPDSMGTPFQFIVNGQPVFMGGANWVPADMFPSRVSPDQYRDLLFSARDAGLNMLRVWGGGIYESDLFYTLADSLGIMIWQDFMFANTMYRCDPEFLDQVQAESTDQIIRLRRHPCLALWCGNNEIDVAFRNWGWATTYAWPPGAAEAMERDYDVLFRQLLPSQVARFHPEVPYVHTSPLSNWGDPADLRHGDNHFWGVWHGEMPFDSLLTRIPRFMSEYGMQSFPTWETIEAFSEPADWDISSPVMRFHQRSYKGNDLITRYGLMEGEIGPGDHLSFREWVDMGHRLQATAYGKALSAHLATQPYCMGSLLWQWNEPWPGASWSVIDHAGRKKPAYDVIQSILTARARQNPPQD